MGRQREGERSQGLAKRGERLCEEAFGTDVSIDTRVANRANWWLYQLSELRFHLINDIYLSPFKSRVKLFFAKIEINTQIEIKARAVISDI